mmetsp:Transcript_1223/g.2304  ORF Transcript_1223/g.2304 Transcript_1223/m.2304 type:complete len:94 (-) Transcript_1223:830-1111(-)
MRLLEGLVGKLKRLLACLLDGPSGAWPAGGTGANSLGSMNPFPGKLGRLDVLLGVVLSNDGLLSGTRRKLSLRSGRPGRRGDVGLDGDTHRSS